MWLVSVKVKLPIVVLVVLVVNIHEAKVTPFTVVAAPFILNAATSVPAVATSLSPEMLVGDPHVITEPSAQAHAVELVAPRKIPIAARKAATRIIILGDSFFSKMLTN